MFSLGFSTKQDSIDFKCIYKNNSVYVFVQSNKDQIFEIKKEIISNTASINQNNIRKNDIPENYHEEDISIEIVSNPKSNDLSPMRKIILDQNNVLHNEKHLKNLFSRILYKNH